MPKQIVIITGPNVWGQYIKQGNQGFITDFREYFGGLVVNFGDYDSWSTYPVSSFELIRVEAGD